MKKRLSLDHSLYTILQILSVALFERSPILQVLQGNGYRNDRGASPNQMKLFNS